jgi:hypothetical protein
VVVLMLLLLRPLPLYLKLLAPWRWEAMMVWG